VYCFVDEYIIYSTFINYVGFLSALCTMNDAYEQYNQDRV